MTDEHILLFTKLSAYPVPTTRATLKSAGIQPGLHWPYPLHRDNPKKQAACPPWCPPLVWKYYFGSLADAASDPCIGQHMEHKLEHFKRAIARCYDQQREEGTFSCGCPQASGYRTVEVHPDRTAEVPSA